MQDCMYSLRILIRVYESAIAKDGCALLHNSLKLKE